MKWRLMSFYGICGKILVITHAMNEVRFCEFVDSICDFVPQDFHQRIREKGNRICEERFRKKQKRVNLKNFVTQLQRKRKTYFHTNQVILSFLLSHPATK